MAPALMKLFSSESSEGKEKKYYIIIRFRIFQNSFYQILRKGNLLIIVPISIEPVNRTISIINPFPEPNQIHVHQMDIYGVRSRFHFPEEPGTSEDYFEPEHPGRHPHE